MGGRVCTGWKVGANQQALAEIQRRPNGGFDSRCLGLIDLLNVESERKKSWGEHHDFCPEQLEGWDHLMGRIDCGDCRYCECY